MKTNHKTIISKNGELTKIQSIRKIAMSKILINFFSRVRNGKILICLNQILNSFKEHLIHI